MLVSHGNREPRFQASLSNLQAQARPDYSVCQSSSMAASINDSSCRKHCGGLHERSYIVNAHTKKKTNEKRQQTQREDTEMQDGTANKGKQR